MSSKVQSNPSAQSQPLPSVADRNYDGTVYQQREQQQREEQKKDICYQKIWVMCHVVAYSAIAIYTLIILLGKQSTLKSFYSTQEQCCVCAWRARDNDNLQEIEFSQCANLYGEYDRSHVCSINGSQYCNATHVEEHFENGDAAGFIVNNHKVSTTSTFLFFRFPKSYAYYGVLSIAIVCLYAVLMIFFTFKYEYRLSSKLFVANIVVALQVGYNYMKAYQYTLVKFPPDALPMCPLSAANATNKPLSACYQNAMSNPFSQALQVMVSLISFYTLYPFAACCILRCSKAKYKPCFSCIDKCLLRFAIVVGSVSVILCLIALIIVVKNNGDNFIIGVFPAIAEECVCYAVGILLLCSAWSVLCLPHFRKKMKYFCSVEQPHQYPTWAQAMAEVEDEYDVVEVSEMYQSTESVECQPVRRGRNQRNATQPLLPRS